MHSRRTVSNVAHIELSLSLSYRMLQVEHATLFRGIGMEMQQRLTLLS